jgi:hypothetical protein
MISMGRIAHPGSKRPTIGVATGPGVGSLRRAVAAHGVRGSAQRVARGTPGVTAVGAEPRFGVPASVID